MRNSQVQCLDKFQFPTMKLAEQVQKKMKNKGRVNPYKCPKCGFYHIGSILGKAIKRRNNKKLQEVE